MKHSAPAYLHLALTLFNTFFVFQILLNFMYEWYIIAQWAIVIGTFALLFLGAIAIQRKSADHFSPGEATTYQFLFAILIMASGVALGILLVVNAEAFMTFMPFEFFILAFMIGYYFLLTRHIFPHKKLRI